MSARPITDSGMKTEFIRMADELERIDALRPDCPTCGDTRSVACDCPPPCRYTPHPGTKACPDCVDGKVSVAQLAATWRAVWDEPYPVVGAADWLLNHLRAVKPT